MDVKYSDNKILKEWIIKVYFMKTWVIVCLVVDLLCFICTVHFFSSDNNIDDLLYIFPIAYICFIVFSILVFVYLTVKGKTYYVGDEKKLYKESILTMVDIFISWVSLVSIIFLLKFGHLKIKF